MGFRKIRLDSVLILYILISSFPPQPGPGAATFAKTKRSGRTVPQDGKLWKFTPGGGVSVSLI